MTVSLTAAGYCTLTADQSGDDDWFAADEVARTFQVDPGEQTISLSPIDGRRFGDRPFDVVAVASSGLPVSISSAR